MGKILKPLYIFTCLALILFSFPSFALKKGRGNLSFSFISLSSNKYFNSEGGMDVASFAVNYFSFPKYFFYSEERFVIGVEYSITDFLILQGEIPFIHRRALMPFLIVISDQSQGTNYLETAILPSKNTGIGDVCARIALSPQILYSKYIENLYSEIFLKIKFPTGDKNGDILRNQIPLGTGQVDYSYGLGIRWRLSFLEPYFTAFYVMRHETTGLTMWIGDFIASKIDPGDEIHINGSLSFLYRNLRLSLGVEHTLFEGVMLEGTYLLDYYMSGKLERKTHVREHGYLTYGKGEAEFNFQNFSFSIIYLHPLLGKNFPEAVEYSDIKSISGLFLLHNFPQMPGEIFRFEVKYEF